MGRSTLMGAESSEGGRRADATPWQSKWWRKIVHAADRAGYVTDGAELFESAASSKRRDQRHRATPVRDLERLPGLDKPQYLARTLPERANSNRLHVLLVAHFRSQGVFQRLLPLHWSSAQSPTGPSSVTSFATRLGSPD
jgi:hypothetical protein